MNFAHAKPFASTANVKKTLLDLKKADQAHIAGWTRALTERDFELVRDDPRVQEFLRSRRSGQQLYRFIRLRS